MGKLLRPNFVTEYFAYLIEKYNLKKIRFHDLRHTCASPLLANGVPMKQIQIWLGHSTFSTTADIYAHLDVSAQVETGDVAGGFFIKSSPLTEVHQKVSKNRVNKGKSLFTDVRKQAYGGAGGIRTHGAVRLN